MVGKKCLIMNEKPNAMACHIAVATYPAGIEPATIRLTAECSAN